MVHCDRIGLSSCAWPGSLSIRDRKTPRGIEFFSFYYPFNSQWPTRAKWKRILRASLSIHSFLFFPLNAHLSHLTRCNNNYFVSGRKKFIIISRARIFLYNLKIPRKGRTYSEKIDRSLFSLNSPTVAWRVDWTDFLDLEPLRTPSNRRSSSPFPLRGSPLPFSISCERSRDLSYFLTPGGLDLGLLPRGSINQWEEDWRGLTSTNCVNGPDSNSLVPLPPTRFPFFSSSFPSLSFSFLRGRSISATTTDHRLWIETKRDKEGIETVTNRSVQELTTTVEVQNSGLQRAFDRSIA